MEQFHFLLMQTFYQTNRKMAALCAAFDLYPGQPKILQTLYERGSLTPKEISKICCQDKSTMTSLCYRMIEKGLVVKRASLEDRRSHQIELTQKGKKLAEKVIEAGANVDRIALNEFSQEEVGELFRLLRKVQKNMEGKYDESNND